MPSFSYERKAGVGQGRIVIGIDEAGRGPLAGPVVAAAVLLDFRKFPRNLRTKVDDLKKLTPEVREHLYERLQNHAQIGVGMASCIEIDRINILRASLLAIAGPSMPSASSPITPSSTAPFDPICPALRPLSSKATPRAFPSRRPRSSPKLYGTG